jgi:UDP-glucose 4-epimerase
VRVLVTGGNGFIGKYVTANLARRDFTPVVFDRVRPELADRMYECDLGDVRDVTAVMQSMARVDGFIHLAGVLGTQETVQNPWPAIDTNIRGGINVLEAAVAYGVPGVNIAVGNYWMNNPYSISKSTVERFVSMYNRDRGATVATVRALNAYGPGQKAHPVKKLMPNIIDTCLRGDPVIVYGDGEQIMDMIFVEDVADILVRALLETVVTHHVPDTPYEAGTGVRTTVNEIVEVVAKQLDVPCWIDHRPMRPGEPQGAEVLGDPTTLAPLGVTELISLEEGVRRTLPSYLARQ